MPSTVKRQTVFPKEWHRRKGLENGGLFNVAGLGKNDWLIFSGSRFNLVSQWIFVETAIDPVLARVFHCPLESLAENPDHLAR